ncbi:Transmembrane protein 39A [Halotydeus destructor]|nr:Transmembrane protein 39A [Halotydeus destructor]
MVRTTRGTKLSSKSFTEDNARVPLAIDSAANIQANPPKHIALPRLPGEHELLFEFNTVVLFIVAMATQYLNLYRTVWWLTQSHTNTFMNFHLIDLNALQFSLTYVGRPFLQFLVLSISRLLPSALRSYYSLVASTLVLIFCTMSQIKSAAYIYATHEITGIMSICYPLVIYLLMYFPNMLQAYENIRTSSKWNWFKLTESVVHPTRFSKSPPVHMCSSSTDHIREEVDRLRSSFNDRLKFILFRSLIIAYYSSFVPLCLAQSQLFYDISWTAQHVGISWLSAFLMLTSHIYSPQFYDILHRAALHLGKWQKLESRNTLVPCGVWSEQYSYTQGVVVKHYREYYKSEGFTNCAEPGNQSHLRYYIVFANPVGGFGTLLGLLIMLITVQLLLLVRTTEWYKLISMSLLIMVNAFTVFRLMRSYYVLKEVYKVESQLQDTKQG